MNVNQFIDTKLEVIGFHKDSVVLLSKEHKKTAVVKIADIQRLLGKLVSQYNDSEVVGVIEENLKY
jgi:hypothetical protein